MKNYASYKVKIVSLGCKTNFYESDEILKLFKNEGFGIAKDAEIPDIFVINTCAVTNTGSQKSRQAVRKCIKENNHAIIVVCGCYSQIEPDGIAKIPNVNIIVGNKNKSKIPQLVEKYIEESNFHSDGSSKIFVSSDKNGILDEKNYEEIYIPGSQTRTRANVKVEDGCNNFCTYCVIPFARGPVRSRDISNIVVEVSDLVKNGYLEVVLTGIHISSYGKDIENEKKLIDVIEAIHENTEISRIRLGSLEPSTIDLDFLDRMKHLPKLCDHFHLALQSGSDTVLQRMARRYTTEEYKNTVNMIRSSLPYASITTDIIVGFPGETDEEFAETMDFAREIEFMKIHVFKYSSRKGTKAAAFPGQISPEIKHARSKKLIELSNKMNVEFYSKFIGKTVNVLFETNVNENLWHGLTKNYMNVKVKSSDNLHGKIVSTKIIGFDGKNLVGEI
jgi:threonylcarbamoyladenosine tRNA methylthiotransferase MtaB